MKLIDVCNLMNVDINRAKKFIAGILNVTTQEVNVKGSVDLTTLKKLADHFPDHNKVIVLTCNPQDQLEIKLMGSWDGRLMRAATRVFNHSYKKYQQALMMEKDDTTFRTAPTKEEIKKERLKNAQRVIEYEIETGIRKEDGSLVGGKPNETAQLETLGEQPKVANRAFSLPNVDPLQPHEPGVKQDPMYNSVGHESRGAPDFGSDKGVEIIETPQTVIRD